MIHKDSVVRGKFAHYYRDVRKYKYIDIYRVLSLFGVTDQGIGHAIKKLVVAGGRGAKDFRKDVTEARDTLNRVLEMMDEDAQPVPSDDLQEAFDAFMRQVAEHRVPETEACSRLHHAARMMRNGVQNLFWPVIEHLKGEQKPSDNGS